jgi:hypothetical protein
MGMTFGIVIAVIAVSGLAYWKLGWKGVAGVLSGVAALGSAYLVWLRRDTAAVPAEPPLPAPTNTTARDIVVTDAERRIEAIEAIEDVDALVDRLKDQS